MERLTWCYNKLLSIEEFLNTPSDAIDPDNPIIAITMYFVNWIDQTFEVLNKLSNIVYRTDVKDDEEQYGKWKNEVSFSFVYKSCYICLSIITHDLKDIPNPLTIYIKLFMT